MANSSSIEKSKRPEDVLAEAEEQWIFTDDDLHRTPSCVNGMPFEEEKRLRGKGVQFITQVMAMLKLPQTAVYTASVFFNRFLMRYSLVSKEGFKALHHYVRHHCSVLSKVPLIVFQANRCRCHFPNNKSR